MGVALRSGRGWRGGGDQSSLQQELGAGLSQSDRYLREARRAQAPNRSGGAQARRRRGGCGRCSPPGSGEWQNNWQQLGPAGARLARPVGARRRGDAPGRSRRRASAVVCVGRRRSGRAVRRTARAWRRGWGSPGAVVRGGRRWFVRRRLGAAPRWPRGGVSGCLWPDVHVCWYSCTAVRGDLRGLPERGLAWHWSSAAQLWNLLLLFFGSESWLFVLSHPRSVCFKRSMAPVEFMLAAVNLPELGLVISERLEARLG